MSLKKQAVAGMIWTLSQQFSVQIINFTVRLILARLLLPEMFGLIAMLSVFIAIGQTLMDSGMTSSLIRTANPTEKDYSTVFFTNVAVSAIIYLILFFSAPVIGQFYNQPILSAILRVYTISFVITSFVGVQTTRLTKDLNFKLQMKMQIPSTLIGAIVGVVLALKGFGVWSLVWLNLTQSFCFMIQHWFFTKWRPIFVFDMERFRYHFKFGSRLTISSLIDTIYNNSYNIVIGKFFTPVSVGYFNQADTIRLFPVTQVASALDKVTYPLFSLIQNDDQKLKKVYKITMQAVLLLIVPLMIFLAVIAAPFFRFLFGEKWLPAVSYFQILCIASLVRPIGTYNLNILKVKGRSDVLLKLEFSKKIIGFVFLFIALPFGIKSIIWSLAITSFLFAFLNAYVCGKFIKYFAREQIRDVLRIFLIGAFSGVVLHGIDFYFVRLNIKADFLRILVDGLVFSSIYALLSMLFIPAIISNVRSILIQKKL